MKVGFVEETEPATEETTVPVAEETEGAAETQTEEAEETQAPTETEETQTVPETQAQLKDVTLKLKKNDFSMGVGYQYTIPLDCDLEYSEIEWSTGNAGIAVIKDGVISTLSKGTTQFFAKYGDQTVSGWIRVKSRKNGSFPDMGSCRLTLLAVHQHIPAKQERNTPKTGQAHQGIDDTAEQRSLTAEEPCNQVKPEQADQTPVQTANDRQNLRNGIHTTFLPFFRMLIAFPGIQGNMQNACIHFEFPL